MNRRARSRRCAFLLNHLAVNSRLVTPPVGFNLFVIQSLTKRDLPYIAWASLPYFLAMCVAVVIIWHFPQIATWLPRR